MQTALFRHKTESRVDAVITVTRWGVLLRAFQRILILRISASNPIRCSQT